EELIISVHTTILDSVPIRIYRKNARGEFTYANTACARDLGMQRPEDVMGKTDFDLFETALAERWRQQELELLATAARVTNQIEEELWTNRRPTWAKTSKFLEPGDNGSEPAIWGISVDITDDYYDLQRYKRAVEGHCDGVWHYDVKTAEIWLSPQCQ